MALNLIDSNDISVSQTGSNIQLNASNNIKNQGTFSENETRIGTWINGKPLYRKVIKKENQASSYSFAGPSNVDVYTRTRVMQNVTSESSWIPDYYWSSSDYLRIFVTSGNYVQIRTSKGNNTFTHWIVLEYTKTTD